MILLPLGMVRAPAQPMPGPAPVMGFPRKQLAHANARLNRSGLQLVTQSFHSSYGIVRWTAPENTLFLASLYGRGGTGYAGQDEYNVYRSYYTQTTYDSQGQVTSGYVSGYSYEQGYPPSNYCEGVMYSNGTRSETCYYYEQWAYYPYEPAQYGGDATAFGAVFTGGWGNQPAYQYVSQDKLPLIQPGQTYDIFLPETSAEVWIQYYK